MLTATHSWLYYIPLWLFMAGGVTVESAVGAETILAVPGCEQTTTNDFSRYITPGWQQFSGNRQRVLLASDPQPYRVFTQRSPYKEEFNESRWKSVIGSASSTIVSEIQGQTYATVTPLLVNGDMTEFGHGKERESMQAMMNHIVSKQPGAVMLPGLGNHDYDQNVGECANNGCARDAVCDQIAWSQAIKDKSSGVSFDYKWDRGSRTHSGSLAYSLDIGKLHIVQLNTEPTYTVNFSTGGFGVPGDKTYFTITSSLDWLARDLREASARGQYSIVNMHRRHGWKNNAAKDGRFKEIIEANKVIGVFAGHLHGVLGKANNIGKVPVFQTGGMLNEALMSLNLKWDTNMAEVRWRVAKGASNSYIYNIDTLVEVSPPVPPSPITIILYKKENYQEQICEYVAIPHHIREFKEGGECGEVRNEARSMKVKGFRGDLGYKITLMSVPFAVDFFQGEYTGDFGVPVLQRSAAGSLPAGISRGNNQLWKGLTRVSVTSSSTASEEVN